jgi:phospholipid/cholesterol/gamma-HCH transport system substrate-binding protein
MNTRRLEFVVGLFVLAGLVFLGFLVIFFGKAVTLGRSAYTVGAVFTNVRGMAPGTPVRHLGIDVGELATTEFTESRDKVRLVLRIHGGHSIPANAKLTIRPEGLLGDYYLEFYGGNMDNGTLATDGSAVVEGETTATLDEIAAKVGDFTKKLEGFLDNLQGNLSSFTGRINRFLDNESLRGDLSAIVGGLGRTLGDPQFQSDVRSFARGLNAILGDEKFQRDLKAAAADAPETVRSFRQMSERVAEAAKRAEELAAKLQELPGKLDVQATRIGDQMEGVAESLRKSLATAGETLASLGEVLTRIKEGRGTVGALVNKDELHEKLIKAVDELNDALIEIGKMADGIRRRWGN